MLACSHAEDNTDPAPGQICVHLLEAPKQGYSARFTGDGVKRDLLCGVCFQALNESEPSLRGVCRSCFQDIEADALRFREHAGKPSVTERASSLHFVLASAWQPRLENVLDIQPVATALEGVWIALQADGNVVRIDFEARTQSIMTRLPASDVDLSQPVTLHLAPDVKTAAVVNTYGSHGVVFDLQSGACMQKLYRGDYHTEHCVFSCAFFENDGRLLLVHATDWNRLDISAPYTGVCLTQRESPTYRKGEETPHCLDYFHCGLTVSPTQEWVADNGWRWHPMGNVVAWSLMRWLHENIWESEDGSSQQNLSWCDWYWNGPLCWINDHTLAVWGYGSDMDALLPIVRVLDLRTQRQTALIAGPQGQERYAYATGEGDTQRFTTRPAGTLLFDMYLFAFAPSHGLSSVYDVDTGERLFNDEAFCPLRYHAGAKQFLARTGDTFQVYALEDNGERQAVSG